MGKTQDKNGLLGWFASNHVAANLLMLVIIAGGIFTIFGIKMEIFPEFSLDTISVTVPYLGATPEDAEKGVCLRVEEAVAGIDGVKRVTSYAFEGGVTTFIEIDEYADTQKALDDVKAEIGRIITFPEQTEKPVITEMRIRHSVISIAVYGDVSEKTLRVIASGMRDDLTAFEDITYVTVSGIRAYEISIEVSEQALRRYGLTLGQVANIISNSSLDVPGGSVKTSGGEILVRTKGQKYYGPEFEKIVVLSQEDGTMIKLGDIANVVDGFTDDAMHSDFDGKRAAFINVSRMGDQSALNIADIVKKYVADKKETLPAGVSLALWNNQAKILRSRLNLLKRNAYYGLFLVFLFLTLFLNVRLAFWVTLGIPISFLGAFWLMPVFGISINMFSLFAFIVSLGLVVDDAIVIGENIYAYRGQGLDRLEAAVKGAREMAMPVILAVLTTGFAFIPLAYTKGVMGKILWALPVIVISVLGFSLVEALLILPAHLSSKQRVKSLKLLDYINKLSSWTEKHLKHFVFGRFARMVEMAVKWRYLTLSIGIVLFLITVSFVMGGYLKFTFFDPVEADNILAELEMPIGTPVEETQKVIERIEQKASQVINEYNKQFESKGSLLKHVSSTVGSQPMKSQGQGPMQGITVGGGQSHLGEVNIELVGAEKRGDVSTAEMKNRWRELVGEIPGVSSLQFISEIASVGKAVNVELSHDTFEVLLPASEELKSILREYAGVRDIADSFERGKLELELSLTDVGRASGLTLSDLARQVRGAFYGHEAQRIQRGRDDVRVMVRYPKAERRRLSDIENMRIRFSDGTAIPFETVAKVNYGRGYSAIKRVDRRRVINVTADVDATVANAGDINDDLMANTLPKLMDKYPGLGYRFSGERRERNESLGSLKTNFVLAMLAIYGLLAMQFRSYAQPLIVMSAIPFGIVGAVWGHVLMGFVFMTKFNLSILSMFGIVALSGVVVNDSLIMINLINKERQRGVKLRDVVRDCATRRFRPIILTSLTTFLGLTPMLLERSLQARFLIPMAISLGFGVLFATLITLLLVPSLYMMLEDAKRRFTDSE